MPTMIYDPVATAKMFRYVREASQNRGLRVEAIQHWSGGEPGEPWCDDFAVGMILDICFQGASPFPRQRDIDGSTVAALAYARAHGWVVPLEQAIPGDLVFSINPTTGLPHHVAILETLNPFQTIAGNTSEDGTSDNGDRVAEHVVSTSNKVIVQYPR
jgi:hypothetical protein